MDKREKVARAICAEKCAFMGEPPCYSVEGEWPNPNCSEPGCHAEAQAAIAALGPVDRPRVKPLAWDLWDGGMTVAKTTIGAFNLAQNFSLCFPDGSYRYYETEEAAKAAAQADYEARILAALE